MKLEITYEINESLLYVLTEIGSHTKQEVWSNLQDMAQKCFKRLEQSGKSSTWTALKYPGTNAKLRISVDRYNSWGLSAKEVSELNIIKGEARIKLHNKNVLFSSKQVEEFLVDKILLGME